MLSTTTITLELQVINKLIEVFKDDKEGLLQAMRLGKINGVEDGENRSSNSLSSGEK